MTREEFTKRVNAIAIEIGAEVEITNYGFKSANAAVKVGRKVCGFVTLTPHHLTGEKEDATEYELEDNEVEKFIVCLYADAIEAHAKEVREFAISEGY